MKDMKGKISISRTSSNKREPYITIELTDGSSHAMMLRVSVEMADFASALTGLACQPMEFDTFRLDVIGKVRETTLFPLYPVSEQVEHPSPL